MDDTTFNHIALRCNITAYICSKFRGLSRSDMEELFSAAYCEASKRLAKCRAGRVDLDILIRWAKDCTIIAWRRENNGQNAFCRAFQPLETPTEEDEREKAEFSDNGAGVERMTRQIDAEDERLPDWVYGVRIERAKLRSIERRIANGFASGKSTHTIRRELRLNWGVFRAKMKNLQTRFRPCYKGLCAWRVSHPLSPL